MNRLADVLSILGSILLGSFVVVSVMYGKDTLPVWITARMTFGLCGLAVIMTIVSLAIQKSWGHDKINARVNGICTVWTMIIAFVYLLL